MPEALELNDGLFIALNEQHLAYRDTFLEGCASCDILVRQITPEYALQLEPELNPDILAAYQIPDGVFDPYRFCLSFLATARKNGAEVYTFTELIGMDISHGQVKVLDHTTGKHRQIGCDAVINAAGPWAPDVASMANLDLKFAVLFEGY